MMMMMNQIKHWNLRKWLMTSEDIKHQLNNNNSNDDDDEPNKTLELKEVAHAWHPCT